MRETPEGSLLAEPVASKAQPRAPAQCKGKAGAPPRQPWWTTAHPLWPGHVDHSGIFPTWVCVTRQPELSIGVKCSLVNDRTQITPLTLCVIFNLCLFSHLFANLVYLGNKLCVSSRRLCPLTAVIHHPWGLTPLRMLVFVISHSGP